ncbi:MAG: transposase [Methanobrevibacter sp.]|nr:transposase [Methanobrevibacter sp.]
MCPDINVVNKGVKVKLYPDDDMKQCIHQNIGNARFVRNKLLKEYQDTFALFKQYGYHKLQCNQRTFNTMLSILKKEYSFLYESESSSLQQEFRDLIKSFKRFFKGISGYPKYKSKRNLKQGFRIQNNNNIKINNNTIILPKLGKMHYRTSPHNKMLLQKSKINNVTIKIEHQYYYAVFNIETEIEEFDNTWDTVGIDLGIRTLATLSNGLKIANLDTTAEDKKIKKYYRRLSKKKYRSNRYNKTLKTLGKWITKKQNKLNDAYHKLSNYIVKNYDIICMENLDIKKIFEEKELSSSLQTIGWRKLIDMIKYKCQWYGKIFIQINRWYPSSKTCSNCGYYNKDLKNEKEWTCSHCQKTHDRDINAAKNIHKQGLIDLIDKTMNLWSRGDSTVILFSIESTSP